MEHSTHSYVNRLWPDEPDDPRAFRPGQMTRSSPLVLVAPVSPTDDVGGCTVCTCLFGGNMSKADIVTQQVEGIMANHSTHVHVQANANNLECT